MNRDVIREKLSDAFENIKTAICKHSDINIKRADGGWSVGEIAGHIIKGTKVDFGVTQKTERQYDYHAASIKDLFLNFQLKFQAAPILQPDLKSYSEDEVLAELNENKMSILRMIEQDDLTETCIEIELPVWGTLTKYEWMVLFENHIIRHTKQINDFNSIVA